MSPLAILHTESSLGWGGQEIRVLTEARGVARAGHRVLLAAPAESRIHRAATDYGVESMAVPIARKSLAGLAAMRRLLAAHSFDVVNTHSSTDTWLTALANLGRRGAPALVRTRHISAPMPGNFATRWLYRTATARIVTTGEKVRDQVIAEVGADPARVVSIATGIDLARFTPGSRLEARVAVGLDTRAPTVGIVATLRSWKGHGYLLEALAALPPETRGVIVGDGPQRGALEAQARTLGLEGRVRFTGNQADVAPWMRAFDVFCLPSYANEGVPQALMQAMACGLPVVTTPVGSIEEIVSEGETGLIVPPRDAEALRTAISALLHDSPRRSALGARAAAVARERFGEALMVERMVEVFRRAAGERRG